MVCLYVIKNHMLVQEVIVFDSPHLHPWVMYSKHLKG